MSYYRTQEHKALRSALIKNWKPWEKSTGPKTKEGKERVSKNAYKGNTRGKLRALSAFLKEQRDLIDHMTEQGITEGLPEIDLELYPLPDIELDPSIFSDLDLELNPKKLKTKI